MKSYRTIGEIEEQYLRDHHEDVGDYINVLFDEHTKDGDTASLLSSLQIVIRIMRDTKSHHLA